jgi:polar amino acid transport system substrate-binding protein
MAGAAGFFNLSNLTFGLTFSAIQTASTRSPQGPSGTVVGVVVVLDTSARPLWLWGPIAAVLTGSFGGLMRDLLRQDRVVANLRGELYPEIAAVWGLAFAIFLEWEGARLQPEEIRLGVIVTILGVFLTRIVAIARGAKGWSYV